MTTNQKWIFAIVAIVVIALVYFNWTAVKAFFTSSSISEGSPCNASPNGSTNVAGTIKNGKCVANVILPEGSACKTPLGADGIITNGVCVIPAPVEGSPCATPGYVGGNNGTIQNGVCVATNQNNPPPSSNNPPTFTAGNYKLTVKNTQGARGYAYVNGQFVVSNSILPYQLQLSSNGYVTSPDLYFQSGNGWVKRSDVLVQTV